MTATLGHQPTTNPAVPTAGSATLGSDAAVPTAGLAARSSDPAASTADLVVPTPDPATTSPASLFLGWDHLEWRVGNARAFTAFLCSAFGFEATAYAGPETGVLDRVSWVVEQGAIRFVITGALGPDSPIAQSVKTHGDGVYDVAISVTDAAAAYDAALARGAVGLDAPAVHEDDTGKLVRASIAAYGDTQHSFVERAAYSGPYAPGFTTENLPPLFTAHPTNLQLIDHCVANVAKGELDGWVDFYRRTLGFDQLVHFDDEQISTEYSALMSTVVWDGSKIVLPINEPADGLRKSQIQEYIDFYGCAGVQHIAMRTDDIASTVSALRARGVRFLRVPDAYYQDVRARLHDLDLPWDRLQELGILIDRDHDGYLLQIFTEMVTDRPTVFFEIIQREGAKGFGAGNFKALFEAIEREQARRGNL
ncbi:MAG TPA: 4-hydroxyphenylpyruvate dioxygenase [Acidimicrobiales bacterium]|jgi:4-hydroxyphenylpyruvate dioxygenase|nr:4-hydroxyphenylpyruvate dioxygenase [Acidimicrobiales bacterium]